jgi:transketolase
MGKSLRIAYGEALRELGATNEKIIAMDADLAHATMSSIFAEAYPERFYNVGIAENNLFCMAAGVSHSGLIPFVSTFSLFGTGRAYEMIRNTISYVNANVKFGLSHSGLSVGEDGGSHQSIEDIALMRGLPGMTVFVPCDPIETKKAVFAAAEIDGPVYIRVARPVVEDVTTEATPFIPGKANILKEGTDICIMATGLMVSEALKAAEELEKDGINAAVVNFHTIKPFDHDCVLKMAAQCGAVVTVEEHSVIGGLGTAVAEVLAGNSAAKFTRIGINDKFGKSGKPADLFKEYGLTSHNIFEKCKTLLVKEEKVNDHSIV